MTEAQPLIEVRDLTRLFPIYSGILRRRTVGVVRAVDKVSFTLREGETLGLVGESGCGKTTTGRLVMGLLEPSSGKISFAGEEIGAGKPGSVGARRRMQMIFQDPHSSLNPRLTVSESLAEPLDIHHLARGRRREEMVGELLEMVGLEASIGRRYPHQLSGGQCQRIGIGRALALEPRLLVADEPVAALDVSIQAQILNLLISIQQSRGPAYLFISHDLGVVRHISHRVAVMYLGKLVEMASVTDLYREPLHPYTQALLEAVPSLEPGTRPVASGAGEVPDALRPMNGCAFRSRCSAGSARCGEGVPALEEKKKGHLVACYRV